jgi:predicted Fe-S protein YdhL (DUF1289 family)
MSAASGLCLGCFRTIEEIREWWDMTPEQRNQVMDTLDGRQAENSSFD